MAFKTGATIAFIGYYTSIPLFLAYENMRVVTIVSTGGRYYECPPSFVVVLDDLVFKGMIATHSISYILVKQLWIALRAETIMISNDERILAKLVKRGNKWMVEVYKDD
ncbi:hypothetical protein CRE_16821 [Caenorhabditis remanei]|uniref:Uncharacterized protein n=1 Tax=Caenorhabditis remanei TaxID=31234 RepID=E3MS65_CAERE|nr:hypothetical protein CRE_16821 [Caenorhabditis remanei]